MRRSRRPSRERAISHVDQMLTRVTARVERFECRGQPPMFDGQGLSMTLTRSRWDLRSILICCVVATALVACDGHDEIRLVGQQGSDDAAIVIDGKRSRCMND